jgi:two-component system NtrC family sensor kinase
MLNMPALQYYQANTQDAIGKPCYQGLRGRSDPCERCDIPSAVWAGRPVTFERKGFMDHDRLEEVVIYPIKEGDSEVGAAIVRVSDITEARFMERQLIRSEKLASLGLLLSGIVHEINNPLAIINEKAGLMKDVVEFSGEFEHRDKFLDLSKSILNSVARAQVIIRRLLGFARRTDIKTETIHLNRLLEEVLEFLEKEAFHRRINVSLSFSPDLPALESDRGQLQQVFLNITKNAFEVVNDGGNVSIATRSKDPDTVHVIIADDGCGMTPEQVKQIFQPFFTSGKESGTGLGLYITHEIVSKNLGGEITVQSEQGKGTTFTVEIPTVIRQGN